MIRDFDLSIYTSNANQLLNDPCLRLIKLDISCSFETGYTSASMRFKPCPKRELKFKRFLKRFIVERENEALDSMLENKDIRVIKQHVFPTIEGTVVVLDYQVKQINKRKVGRA